MMNRKHIIPILLLVSFAFNIFYANRVVEVTEIVEVEVERVVEVEKIVEVINPADEQYVKDYKDRACRYISLYPLMIDIVSVYGQQYRLDQSIVEEIAETAPQAQLFYTYECLSY